MQPVRFLLPALAALALSACGGSQAVPVEVKLDPSQRFQTMEGFGTCLISWDGAMAEWYRRPEAAEIYSRELGFTMLRCNLWGDGTIGEMPAEQIRHTDPAFAAGDSRTPVFLDFARRLLALNPETQVIGTVWSPPAWMKENNSITDTRSAAIDGSNYLADSAGDKYESYNRVRPDRYPHFTRWLVEMVRYYEANGVPLSAVSPANEPQFTQTFESCLWTARDLAIITGLVGQALEEGGLGGVRVFGPETMTGFNWQGGPNFQYTQAMRDNPLAWQHLDLWATHGYADGVVGDVSTNSSAQFWEMIRGDGLPYWVTEGGTGGHDWPAPVQEGGVGLAIHNALVAGQASAFVPWQFAENSRSEHNLMPLEGFSKKTHVVRHFSRFIPVGAQRIGATPEHGDLNVSAFLDGDRLTVVIINTGSVAARCAVDLGGRSVSGLRTIVTSAGEDSAEQGPASLDSVTVPGPGIVTLTNVP